MLSSSHDRKEMTKLFTGIVEEVGTITKFHKKSERAIELSIKAKKVLEDVQIGDSIAVNGICLTVTHFSKEQFSVDVMPETVKATSLNGLTTGSTVNLERSMKADGRFGGHFVTGHVDGVGKIVRKETVENATYYDIEVPGQFMPYFIMKGSIAVDGVSLTIFGVKENIVTISLIPHTLSETVLGDKDVGSIVNIECDVMAKHIENQLKHYEQNIKKEESHV